MSPSGVRVVFMYGDVSRSFDKKTAGFDFPDADGTFVQDSGKTGRKYPITAYFTGDDCDLEADRFEIALGETGRGKLEHPIYGTVDAIPFGTVTRSDALVTAANQSIVEVTFWETIPLIYPIPQVDPASQVLQSVRELSEALGESLSTGLDLTNPSVIAAFKSKMTAVTKGVQNVLGKINGAKELLSSKVSKILTTIDAIVTPTLDAVEGVRSSVKDLVDQVMGLVTVPGELTAPFTEKFAMYKEILKSFTDPIFPIEDDTDYLVDEAFAEAVLGGTLVTIVESDTSNMTQGEVLQNAENILEMLDDLTKWTEETRGDLGLVNAQSSYQKLLEAVSLTAGYLVNESFSLKKERVLVLDRARTIIDVAAQFYGSVDDMLDTLIDSNNLTGSEILELPRGKRVTYYV